MRTSSNSGFSNVSDVLRNLAANGQGRSARASARRSRRRLRYRLRGLTVGDTLTLIDSERMVAYPLSDDGERSFVDVTAIPFNAIDTVEVLKDGASALYGADAIAGVVNIKLKPTYVGSEIMAEAAGRSHNDGCNMHAAAIVGWGDLANDGYNIYAALDWHREEMIWGTIATDLDQPQLERFPRGQKHDARRDRRSGSWSMRTAPGISAQSRSGEWPAGADFLPGCTAQLTGGRQVRILFPGPDSAAHGADEFSGQDDQGSG